MIHSEEIHVERLASICRICAKKSKASSKEAKKPVACVRFQELIKTYYFIDIDDDNRLQHSTVMCSSCRKRLERCKNGQKQNQDLQTDLALDENKTKK